MSSACVCVRMCVRVSAVCPGIFLRKTSDMYGREAFAIVNPYRISEIENYPVLQKCASDASTHTRLACLRRPCTRRHGLTACRFLPARSVVALSDGPSIHP